MSSNTREALTTKELVLQYISEHAKNGQIQASLRELEAELGIHYSTISRVLNQLASENIVRILPRGIVREPSTIELVSEMEGIDFAAIGKCLAIIAKEVDKMQKYIAAQNRRIEELITTCSS